MSTFKVDNEQINSAVETLRKLLDECEEVYSKEIPESTVDKGLTHTELEEFCKNIKTNCQYLGELINNTIRFLGEASEMFETSDRESAEAISEIPAGNLNANAYAGSNASFQEYVNSSMTVEEFNGKVEELKDKEGFTHGTPWGTGADMRAEYKGKTYKDGKECCAMARMMQYEVFGEKAEVVEGELSFEDIRVGDVVYVNKVKGDRSGTTCHYVFVIEKGKDYIIVGEGNAYAKGYGSGCVSWGNEILKDDILEIKQIERIE